MGSHDNSSLPVYASYVPASLLVSFKFKFKLLHKQQTT